MVVVWGRGGGLGPGWWFGAEVVVWVKWSACSPSTPSIRVRILLKSKVLVCKLFEMNKNNQKEAGDGLFL